ncbi:xaa-Arg dipeptidase-like [Dysidea avara]|uniref:xaa-Arg dipeptidase-like n=1 Tax=Dysidea avara TaxID=196820 RepID=UPI0033321D13
MATHGENLKRIAINSIDENAIFLQSVGEQLWQNPELSFEEYKAHDLLVSALEKHQFHVERSYLGIQTAFRATFGDSTGPNVCVICEYDALPDIGHACGHNLIAEAGLAAALGIKAALKVPGAPKGTLTVMGTPAEEASVGKILLTEKGAFNNVDFALIVHPYPANLSSPICYALLELQVTFCTAATNWEGSNALDAAVIAYNNVSVLRQQIMPGDRVHGVITNGGTSVAIVPSVTVMEWNARATTTERLRELEPKIISCFEAAAMAAGCSVEVKQLSPLCKDVLTNTKLASLYCENATQLGMSYDTKPTVTFSTDMGNVSYAVPSIHPMYIIGDGTQANHTREFTMVTNTPAAHHATLTAAKAVAMTTIDVLTTPETLEQIKAEFQQKANH